MFSKLQLSYVSVLFCVWLLALSIVAFFQGYYVQLFALLIVSSRLLFIPHGEVRLLVPFCLFSEFLLAKTCGLAEFYDPTALYGSWLAAFICGLSSTASAAVLGAAASAVCTFIFSGQLTMTMGIFLYAGGASVTLVKLTAALGQREALLVSMIFGFFSCDAVVNRNFKVENGRFSAVTSVSYIISRAALLAASGLVFLVSVFEDYARFSRLGRSLRFYTSLFIVLTVAYFEIAWELGESPVLWMIGYISATRVHLCALVIWTTLLPLVIALLHLYGSERSPRIIRRKYFHFIALMTLMPVVFYDPEFLVLSVAIATALALTVEVARMHGVNGTGGVNAFCAEYIDERDMTGGRRTIRTHLYLIIGFEISAIFALRQVFRRGPHGGLIRFPNITLLQLIIIPGFIALGVCDSVAAIAGTLGNCIFTPIKGRKFRAKQLVDEASFLKRSRPTALATYLCGSYFPVERNHALVHKSVIGTICGFLAGLLSWGIIRAFSTPRLILNAIEILPAVSGILACSLFEACTDGIDNIELPLFTMGVIQTAVACIFTVMPSVMIGNINS